MTCARCGAQNPDGNLYCQNCGTPLTAAQPSPPLPGPPQSPYVSPPPPVSPAGQPSPPGPPGSQFIGPPPGISPPVAGPTGYQSPYYAPAAPVAPLQRTPWTLIIAGVVALVVLMAGFGTAFAVIAYRGSFNTNGTAIGSDIPSPTPGATPSPIASPTPTALGATTESNGGVTLKVPQGWSVASKDNESIVLTDPDGVGSVTVASGPSSPTETAQENKTSIDSYFKSKYPDARACTNTSTTTSTFNGAKGLSWTLCFTVTEGGHSAAAAASLFAGANAGGDIYYVAMVFTRQDNLQAYLTAARPVLQSVTWKLV